MVELTDYQKLAIENLKTGSILVGGVGSGKSLTSLGYFFIKVCGGKYGKGIFEKPTNPIDLYIITTAQKRDKHEWEDEAAHYCLSVNNDISICGIKVTIDSWNNIKKYENVEKAFFIFDEQRLVGYGAWTKSFLKITKTNDWLLLSATPGDQWSDYISVFVANGFYKNKTDFARRHIVYKPFMNYPVIDRYIDEFILQKHKESISVYMDFKRDATRSKFNVKCGFNKDLYFKTLKERYDFENDKMLDSVSALSTCLRKIINTDVTRVTNIVHLVRENPRSIIFYNYNYELLLLRDTLQTMSILYSEWNGHKHDPIPSSSSWVYLVQYNAGCEGWNCTETDTIIFFSLNYSYRIMEQAAGRIDRMNTPFKILKYYYFYTPGSIDDGIRRCIKRKKIFNEKRYFDDSQDFHSL